MPNLGFLFNLINYLFLFCVYVFVHMCMGVLVFVEVGIMPNFYVGTKD